MYDCSTVSIPDACGFYRPVRARRSAARRRLAQVGKAVLRRGRGPRADAARPRGVWIASEADLTWPHQVKPRMSADLKGTEAQQVVPAYA
jgi:hypothetical protein